MLPRSDDNIIAASTIKVCFLAIGPRGWSMIAWPVPASSRHRYERAGTRGLEHRASPDRIGALPGYRPKPDHRLVSRLAQPYRYFPLLVQTPCPKGDAFESRWYHGFHDILEHDMESFAITHVREGHFALEHYLQVPTCSSEALQSQRNLKASRSHGGSRSDGLACLWVCDCDYSEAEQERRGRTVCAAHQIAACTGRLAHHSVTIECRSRPPKVRQNRCEYVHDCAVFSKHHLQS